MHHQFLPLRSMILFGVVPLKVIAWYCLMHVVLPQKLIFSCLHQHKTAQVLMITEFLHMIFWISFKPRGPCSGSILHLSITGICNVFWRGTPGFPMIDEHLSMPGCLLALIIRRQLPRWQQRGARHVRWSPSPEPGKAFLKGDNGGWTHPFQKARFMGAAKICKKPWPNNRWPSWMVERCFNKFWWRWQNEMRKTRILTVSSFKTVGCAGANLIVHQN